MELDLNQSRYQTFDELKDYCYKVASTVGLMTIPVFGYKNKSTEEYAVNLGIALQLTNIIRDVKTDAERGRIYLPLNDLKKFNYSEAELFDNVYNENFVNLMKFESEQARKYYSLADNKLQREDRSSLFTARAMEYIYYRLLDKIELAEFNVFKEKIRVSNINKLFISSAVWLKYKLLP
jgi:phytoene synthase